MCLGQGADLRMVQLMTLPIIICCSSKSRLVLPFWFWLTQVVPDKIQKGRKMVVCVCVCVVNKLHHKRSKTIGSHTPEIATFGVFNYFRCKICHHILAP